MGLKRKTAEEKLRAFDQEQKRKREQLELRARIEQDKKKLADLRKKS